LGEKMGYRDACFKKKIVHMYGKIIEP
jgi:hypothetical protein